MASVPGVLGRMTPLCFATNFAREAMQRGRAEIGDWDRGRGEWLMNQRDVRAESIALIMSLCIVAALTRSIGHLAGLW